MMAKVRRRRVSLGILLLSMAVLVRRRVLRRTCDYRMPAGAQINRRILRWRQTPRKYAVCSASMAR